MQIQQYDDKQMKWREGHALDGEGKKKEVKHFNMVDVLTVQEWIWNFLTNGSHHKKGTKVEKRKTEKMNQFWLQCIYTCKCHKDTPCVAILNK
jgi:hypothetical protein